MQGNTRTNRKQHIRNPHKWIGRSVLHMANWRDYYFGECALPTFAVCEQTKRMMYAADDYSPTEAEREILGDNWDPCYYYSYDGIQDLLIYAERQRATS